MESSQHDEEGITKITFTRTPSLIKTPHKHENCPRTQGCTERVASGVEWSFGDEATGMPEIASHVGRHVTARSRTTLAEPFLVTRQPGEEHSPPFPMRFSYAHRWNRGEAFPHVSSARYSTQDQTEPHVRGESAGDVQTKYTATRKARSMKVPAV